MLEHSRLAALCAVPTLMLVMSWVTVMLRCWVKKRILKTFTWDDWFMLLSLGVFTGMVGVQYRKTAVGLGQHVYDLTPDASMEFLKLFYIAQIIYILLTILLKTSISIFLLRISIDLPARLITYGTLGLYTLASLYFVISIVVQCAPAAYFWDKEIPGGKCQDSSVGVANALAAAALSAGTDLVYCVLPLWLVRGLRMDWRGKVSVGIILSMGLLSTAATCVRFKYIVPLTSSTDFTYDVYGIEIWSTIEPGLGITAASAATLRPLLRLFTAKLGLGSSNSVQQQQQQQHERISSGPSCGAGAGGSGGGGGVTGGRGSRLVLGSLTGAASKRIAGNGINLSLNGTGNFNSNSRSGPTHDLTSLSKYSLESHHDHSDVDVELGRSGAGPEFGRWDSESGSSGISGATTRIGEGADLAGEKGEDGDCCGDGGKGEEESNGNSGGASEGDDCVSKFVFDVGGESESDRRRRSLNGAADSAAAEDGDRNPQIHSRRTSTSDTISQHGFGIAK